MDEVSKFRLMGAIIWLMLLVVLVPIWFGEPVNFKPEGYVQPESPAERPLVEQVYMLPDKAPQPNALGVQKKSGVQDDPRGQNNKIVTKKEVAVSEQKKSKGGWIVKVATFKKIKDANNLLGRLEETYDVTIKEFKKDGMYSVRVGPYSSKSKAEKNKQKLDKALRVQSVVMQLK